MANPLRTVALVGLAVVMLAGRAWAEPRVESIEPAGVAQGDTVLLTLSGEELPSGGNVRVEFFPQQIVVLAILSSTERELSLQVKVAASAPAGSYNVLVYDLANRGGAEVLGEGLLRVESDVATPLFTSFDPKVIAEATNGFALLLTGQQIMAEAVPYLRMEWSQSGVALSRLETTLAYSGQGKVVCAVEGAPPAGILRGKIFLGDTPIYLVEITVQGDQAIFIGHSPAQLFADGQPGFARFLGAGFSNQFLELLTIRLTGEGGAWLATQKERLDHASFLAEFPAGIPIGEYTIDVLQGDLRLYSGSLWFVEAPAEVPVRDVEVPPAVDPVAPPDTPDIIYSPPTGVRPTGAQGTLATQVYSVSPDVMPEGEDTLRLEFKAESMTINRINQVEAELLVKGESASLKFVGSLTGGFLCLFDPPLGGWPVGEDGLLLITDSSTHEVVFTRRIPSAASGTIPQAIPEPKWEPSPTDSQAPVAEPPVSEVPEPDVAATEDDAAQDGEFVGTVVEQEQPGTQQEDTAEQLEAEPQPVFEDNVETEQAVKPDPVVVEPVEDASQETPQVDPVEEPEAAPLEIVQETAAEAAEAAMPQLIALDSNIVVYDDGGFMLQLRINGAIPPHEQLAIVELAAEQVLLRQNVGKFQPVVMGSGAPGIVLLVFRRIPDALSQDVYELMMDSLAELPELMIVLRWVELGIELPVNVAFSSAE